LFGENPAELRAGDRKPVIISRGEASIQLGPTPTRLLYMLACYFERFVSSEQLMLFVWHDDNEPEDAYANITVHICRIRKLVKKLGLKLASASGYGYRLVEGDRDVYTITYYSDSKAGPGRKWTLEEKKTAIKMAKDGHDMRAISKALGRSDTAVRRKLLYDFDMHGVPSDHNPRPWTKEEDKIIRNLAGRPVAEIARTLDRGEVAVRSRLYYKRLRGHGQHPSGRRE
jgi:DNA-binding winged helix-turn-helix (wHTH) protein